MSLTSLAHFRVRFASVVVSRGLPLSRLLMIHSVRSCSRSSPPGKASARSPIKPIAFWNVVSERSSSCTVRRSRSRMLGTYGRISTAVVPKFSLYIAQNFAVEDILTFPSGLEPSHDTNVGLNNRFSQLGNIIHRIVVKLSPGQHIHTNNATKNLQHSGLLRQPVVTRASWFANMARNSVQLPSQCRQSSRALQF